MALKISSLQASTIKLALLWATLLVGLTVKPSRTRRVLYFPISCLIFGSIIFQHSASYTRRLPFFDYMIGLAAANFMCQASDFIFLNEPQLTLRRAGQDKLANELGLSARIAWASDLISNTRGVNWNYEAPNLRRSKKSRWAFVIENLVKSTRSYLILDVLSYAMRHNQAFHHNGNEPMGTHGFIWQVWNAMGYWTILYSYIQLSHTLGSALMVLVGEGPPRDYPDYNGPIGETTTVRKFWGRTWHQSLRRMVSAHGKHFANVFLGHPKGTIMSAYLQLFIAFLFSGIIHGSADFVATRNIHSFYRNILYFTLQAVAISSEDAMITFGKKIGIQRVPKVVGYAWVVTWMVLSGPIWLETLITGRLFNIILPFSILDLIFKN